jgi:hypothetical protein
MPASPRITSTPLRPSRAPVEQPLDDLLLTLAADEHRRRS